MAKDDVFNVEEKEKAKEEAQKKLEQEDKQRKINFGITFSSSAGFEVLKDIALMCHAQQISYVPHNQFETAFREGERNVFLYILSNLSDEMKSKIINGG